MKNKVAIALMILGGSLLSNTSVNAQDTRFTQLYQNPLILNPAIMGASGDMTAGLCYRNQWGTISNGYSSYSFNGMYPIFFGDEDKNKMDAGLSIYEDKAGAFTKLNAMVAVDYNRQIADDQYLCLALLGGFGQQSVSTGSLTFDDQYVHGAYSSSNPSNEMGLSSKKGYADVGFGFTWYFNPPSDKSKVNAYLGIAGFHMNQPNVSMVGSVSKLPLKMSYIGGIKIFESEKIDITPNVMLTTQAGNIESAFGSYLDYNFSADFKMTLGIWYRNHDALPILLGFEYKGFALGYSYDAVTSTINSLSSGINANEITLTYRLNRRKGGGTTASFTSSGGTTLGGKAAPTTGTSDNISPFPKF